MERRIAQNKKVEQEKKMREMATNARFLILKSCFKKIFVLDKLGPTLKKIEKMKLQKKNCRKLRNAKLYGNIFFIIKN